jgi:hypothetical protein
MHRDLMAMSDRTRANDDRLTSSITAVQASLKQLAQQVERSAVQPQQPPKPRPAFAERMRGETERDETAQRESGSPRSMTGAPAKPKTLRTKLTPAAQYIEEGEMSSSFGAASRPRPLDEAVDLDSPTQRGAIPHAEQDGTFDTPADLIAAARRAAEARARKEEAKTGAARSGSVTTADMSNLSTEPERPLMQKRSLLIAATVILLAISAAFLYERLESKPEPVLLPPVIEQSAPVPETPPTQSDSWAPLPQPSGDPDKNAATGGTTGNFTEITKSSYRPAPPSTDPAEPQAAAFGQGVSLPPGIVFSVEDPSKPQEAPAEAVPSPAPSADPANLPEAINPALVARAQELLNKLGYSVGTPDGEVDARTSEAILRFERTNGLTETGKVTIQLVTVLERLTS